MKITVAEAINLKSILGNRMRELISLRSNISTVSVPTKDTEYNKPIYNVEEVTSELEVLIEDSSKLTELLSKVNVENSIEFRGSEVSLSYALDIVKHLRGELIGLKNLASRNKESYNNRYGEASYEIALYEPEIYEKKAKELEKEVNRLSILINTNNYSLFVEVPFAEKYLS